MAESRVDWPELTAFAHRLGQPGQSPGAAPQPDWEKIDAALETLSANGDWSGIIRLRSIFKALLARDSVTATPALQRLSQMAIRAAEQINDKATLAHLLGANGHNLHRQGYHQAALAAFERSYHLYAELGQEFAALQNYCEPTRCRYWPG